MPDSTKRVNNFDVLKEMGKRNGKIFMAPLDNITDMRKVKAGTKITIGVGKEVIHGILAGEYVGGFILADRAEYERILKEMEDVPPPQSSALQRDDLDAASTPGTPLDDRKEESNSQGEEVGGE